MLKITPETWWHSYIKKGSTDFRLLQRQLFKAFFMVWGLHRVNPQLKYIFSFERVFVPSSFLSFFFFLTFGLNNLFKMGQWKDLPNAVLLQIVEEIHKKAGSWCSTNKQLYTMYQSFHFKKCGRPFEQPRPEVQLNSQFSFHSWQMGKKSMSTTDYCTWSSGEDRPSKRSTLSVNQAHSQGQRGFSISRFTKYKLEILDDCTHGNW